jgi:hypothetical protein
MILFMLPGKSATRSLSLRIIRIIARLPEQAITLLTKLEKRNLQPDPRICLGSSLSDPFQLMSCDP